MGDTLPELSVLRATPALIDVLGRYPAVANPSQEARSGNRVIRLMALLDQDLRQADGRSGTGGQGV